MIAHEVLDRVSEDEDIAVVLELSDGLVAGGKVILVRSSSAWEVVIEVGDRSFWPTYSVWRTMRGQVSDEPPHREQTNDERRQLTVDVLDRLHGDPAAQREVLEATRRWKQRKPAD